MIQIAAVRNKPIMENMIAARRAAIVRSCGAAKMMRHCQTSAPRGVKSYRRINERHAGDFSDDERCFETQ